MTGNTRQRRRSAVVAAAATAAMTLTACTPGAETPADGGGIALVALVDEPGVLSPFFTTQSSAEISSAFVIEPLFNMLGDGTHEALLAAEIPTIENGGVSDDGLTITITLRDDVTWSDGEPLTADDLAFTVAVAHDPESVAFPGPEYDAIESVEVTGEHELVLHMTQPEPGYLNLFSQVLPEHGFESPTIATDDPGVRMPLGTGPFVYEEWRSGDSITLVANEDYWRDPELPRLDGVNIKITPDKQAATAAYIAGAYDSVYFFSSGDLPELVKAHDDGAPIVVELDQEIPGFVEYLWLNHSDGGDPTAPHPMLGDPAIREAIDHGIDRTSIVDELLGGYGLITGAFLSSGFGSVDRDAAPYDPDHAREVLDAAGWVPGADGVREKDGVRASVLYQTVSGDQDRTLYQQFIQQNMAEIGIEFVIENVASGVLFDSLDEGGLLATGDYDIVMSRDGRYSDPGLWVYTFTSLSIPTAENNGVGFTYSHWRNDTWDELGWVAATTMDLDERTAVLAELDELFVTERVAIPVFASVLGLSWSSQLENVETDYWEGIWNTASTAQWSLAD